MWCRRPSLCSISPNQRALSKIKQRTSKPEITEQLLSALQNDEIAVDNQLPDTGVGLQLERLLSPAFITSPSYGTRTSTVVIIEGSYNNVSKQPRKAQKIYFHERQYHMGKSKFDDKTYTLNHP